MSQADNNAANFSGIAHKNSERSGLKISRLDPKSYKGEIHKLLISAYRVEADLLGVGEDFPPLNRTPENLAAAETEFYGLTSQNRPSQILALAELDIGDSDHAIHIDSFVVSPEHHKRGLGRALLRELLLQFSNARWSVTTDQRNLPACRLYKSSGFTQQPGIERFQGYEIVRFELDPQ